MNATQFYEIKSWLDGSVLFSGQFGSLKLCVEAAVSAKVSFARASLDGANLYGATLDGATLVGANDIIMLGQPDGWRAYAYRAKTTIRVQVGCQNKTLSKGREYWADKPDRREVLAALDYAEKVAGLRGWTFGEEG